MRCDTIAGIQMPHPFGEQQVDVQSERGDGRAYHFRQRMAGRALHLLDDATGVDDARGSRTAQYAVDEVPQIAAQQHVDQEDGVGHLVAVGAHGGADVASDGFASASTMPADTSAR